MSKYPKINYEIEEKYNLCKSGPVKTRKLTKRELAELNRKYPSPAGENMGKAFVGVTVVDKVLEGIKFGMNDVEIATEHGLELRTVRRYITMHKNGTLRKQPFQAV